MRKRPSLGYCLTLQIAKLLAHRLEGAVCNWLWYN